MSPSPEIQPHTQSSEIIRLQQACHAAAVESFVGKLNLPVDTDPAVLQAEITLAEAAREATQETGTQLSLRQEALIHLGRTMSAMDKVIGKGLIATPEEAEVVTDALVWTDINPSSALKYLSKQVGRMERVLSPGELAGALTLLEDCPDASISALARAADMVGVALEPEMGTDEANRVFDVVESFTGEVAYRKVVDSQEGPIIMTSFREVGRVVVPRPVSDGQVVPLGADAPTSSEEYIIDYAVMSGDTSVLGEAQPGDEPRL